VNWGPEVPGRQQRFQWGAAPAAAGSCRSAREEP